MRLGRENGGYCPSAKISALGCLTKAKPGLRAAAQLEMMLTWRVRVTDLLCRVADAGLVRGNSVDQSVSHARVWVRRIVCTCHTAWLFRTCWTNNLLSSLDDAARACSTTYPTRGWELSLFFPRPSIPPSCSLISECGCTCVVDHESGKPVTQGPSAEEAISAVLGLVCGSRRRRHSPHLPCHRPRRRPLEAEPAPAGLGHPSAVHLPGR